MSKTKLTSYGAWACPPATLPEWVARAEVAIRATCWYFNISKKELIGLSKSDALATARFVVIYILRKEFRYTTFEIGYRVRRDHSTVCYAIRSVEKKPDKYQTDIHALRAIISYMGTALTGAPAKTYRFLKKAA